MDLKILSDLQLTNELDRLVRSERKITHLILCYINEIETRKLHAHMGFSSMYEFLTRKMGYSEKSAYSRLQAARLMRQIPEVAQKIEHGSVNLSQLTKIQQCIRENVREGKEVTAIRTLEIIEQIENKNLFDTKAILSKEFDVVINDQFERAEPQKDESIRLEITLTKEQFMALCKAKELLSHVCPEGKWSDIIGTLAEKFTAAKNHGRETASYNVKKDNSKKTPPSLEAQDSVSTTSTNGNQMILTRSLSSKPNRPYIPEATKRSLLAKAKGRCEYRNHKDGTACGSAYQLQIDHIKPVASGGSSEIENLRVMCRTHNILAAEKLGLRR